MHGSTFILFVNDTAHKAVKAVEKKAGPLPTCSLSNFLPLFPDDCNRKYHLNEAGRAANKETFLSRGDGDEWFGFNSSSVRNNPIAFVRLNRIVKPYGAISQFSGIFPSIF